MINLHFSDQKKLMEAFFKLSYLAGRLDKTYGWDGVKGIKIYDAVTVPTSDYARTGLNRYGMPTELQDVRQSLNVTQDKGFAFTIDAGNQSEQQYIKDANKMLAKQLREVNVPEMDRYGFNRLRTLAGTIVSYASVDKDNILDYISDGTVALDDAEFPDEGRTLFVPTAVYKLLKHSPEFIATESLAKVSLAKGQVGTYDNMPVVKVVKGRWPQGLLFLIVHENAGALPVKLDKTKLHIDPPGISGALVEGRQIYDAFVYGRRCNGVYAAVLTAAGNLGIGAAQVAQAPTVNPATGAFTGEANSVFTYTVDGTDPRYFDTRKVGTGVAAEELSAGTVVKVYAEVNGKLPSAVTTQVLTG